MKLAGGPLKCCPTCGVCLVTAAELSEILDMPHSTVAARLRQRGVSAQILEGARELYISAHVLPVLLRNEARRGRW